MHPSERYGIYRLKIIGIIDRMSFNNLYQKEEMKEKTMTLTYEEIGKTLEKFVLPIGGSFKLFDKNMHLHYDTKPSPLCKILLTKAPAICKNFMEEIFSETKKTKEPFIEKCPVGKLVFAIPIHENNQFLGAAIGSVGFASFSRRRRRTLIEISKEANIPEEKLLKVAENEFLSRKYFTTTHKNIFFREIRNRENLINILNRFARTLKIKAQLKKIKTECKYTYELADAVEYMIAGNFSKNSETEGITEEKLIKQLVEIAKETCRELLDIAMSESIRWKAYHDNLTGVYNRYVLDEEISKIEELKIAPVAFILIDMDNLKKINDKYGHKAGDKAIYAVAQSIKEAVRRNDIVVRLGGDEFIIVLPGFSEKKVMEIIYRIERNIKEVKKIHNLPFNLTVSMGYEIIQKPEKAKDAIIKADKKMYSCKKCKKDKN